MPFKTTTEALASIKPDLPLYVINRSDQVRLGNSDPVAGDINMSVKVDGELESVKIYKTWVPIDLSLQVAVATIGKNPTFRRLVTRGFIEIIPADEAERTLSGSAAQSELDRIANKGAIAQATMDAAAAGGTPPQMPGQPQMPAQFSQATASNQPSNPAIDNNLLLDPISRYREGKMTIAVCSNVLRSLTDAVSREDIRLALSTNIPADLSKVLNEMTVAKDLDDASESSAPVAAAAAAAVTRSAAPKPKPTAPAIAKKGSALEGFRPTLTKR